MSSTSPPKIKKKRTLKSPLQQHLLQGTDLGILSAIFLVPLFLGGRLGAGQLALFSTAGVMALCWLTFQSLDESPKYRVTRFEPILILAALLLWFQCAALPPDWIAMLSPHIGETLSLWQGNPEATYDLGGWSSISLTPAATRQGLLFLIAYTLLFIVTTQRLRHVDDIEKVFRWMALASLGMATIGLAQYFFGNGRFLWSYAHPTITTDGSAKGSFTNGNHFAHFLMLGAGPLLWWIMKESVAETETRTHRSRRKEFQYQNERPFLAWTLMAGMGVVIFAVLMGLTRGGALALAISLSVCVLVCWSRGFISARLLGGLTLGGVLAGGALSLYGLEEVSTNLNDWEVDRWLIWEANLKIANDYPILGTGLGSHFQSYRSYLNTPLFESRFSHAESGYLQVLSETGIVGLSLLSLAMLFPLYWCLRGLQFSETRQEVILFAALMGSFVANYLHAIVDFVWWVPACMTLLLIQAACACRLYQITRRRHESRKAEEPVVHFPRLIVWGLTSFAALLCGWLVQESVGVWRGEQEFQAFQRKALINVEADDSMGASVGSSYARAENTDNGFSPEERQAYAQRQVVEQVSLLIHASLKNPQDAELRYRVAEGYLIYFELLQSKSDNPMSTPQIRDAVFASEFENVDDMQDWLKRAFGNNVQFLFAAFQHTKAAIKLCPLQGDAYLQLSQLAFLDGAGPDSVERCLQQAQQVRPYDADVLFELGRFEWSQMQYDEALEYWKQAFHQEIRTQKRIIRLVAGPLGPAKFLKIFEPDWQALRRIVQQYRLLKDESALKEILPLYAERAIQEAGRENNPEPVRAWMQAAVAYQELGQSVNAERCLVAALKRYPNEYQLHETYGKLLYTMNRMEESEKELRWCLTYQPDDVGLRKRYELAQHKRLQSKSPIRLTSGQPSESGTPQ
ncbi:O-Antigen ligase [Polystyrenella longa]|uniref:O-Antigen ligase n=1 Tax=Polystyrenella longa TaxID=2528007 RepID=A0A518CHE4_9PLAN|nr:O-antigen ligase family protein [Polystyrenella longa]QDU78642.1 O-Antigen ligase [Polystyrenella longa]